MKKFISTIFFLTFSLFPFNAQSQPTPSPINSAWVKTFGNNRWDYFMDIKKSSDGNFIAFGGLPNSSTADNSYNAWVIKMTANGEIIWENRYGAGTTINDYFPQAMETTNDGGSIIVLNANGTPVTNPDRLVIKLDTSGNIIWQKRIGGTGTFPGDPTFYVHDEYTNFIINTSDGGFLLGGETTSYHTCVNFCPSYAELIKLSSNGTVVWEKTYEPSPVPLRNTLYSATETPDLGFMVAGKTSDNRLWVLKVDSSGNLLWDKTYSDNSTQTPHIYYAQPRKIIKTINNDYVIVGSIQQSLTTNIDRYGWVVRLNPNGNILWEKQIRDANGVNFAGAPVFNDIFEDNNGDLTLVGEAPYQVSTNYFQDIQLIKLTSSGNYVWGYRYGGLNDEHGKSLRKTNRGMIIAGVTKSIGAGNYDGLVMKLRPDGTIGNCSFPSSPINPIIYTSNPPEQNVNSVVISYNPTSIDTAHLPINISNVVIEECVVP